MYEAEVNDATESIETIPLEIRKQFAESRSRVEARTVLPWGEHCTECVWPTCYTTCELYAPRKDGACRQFVDGVVRIDFKDGANPYLLKLRFKRWAKLWTVGNLDLHSLPKAAWKEWLNIAIGTISQALPLPKRIKVRVLVKNNYLRRRLAENAKATEQFPDCFMLECFNPNERAITLTFTVRPRIQKSGRPFQQMVSVSTGYTKARIAYSEISRCVDTRQPFEVEIVPNDCDDTTLYFGLVDFVKERSQLEGEAGHDGRIKKCKCIVWDLDNTLWEGTLIEDGLDKIRLRQSVVEVIKEMDTRGILHSIASKNNCDDAMTMLRLCGMEEYFLYPQINWQPKSQSVARIAQLLNIGADTLIFVDDQQFEREEVKAAIPQVLVVDAAHHASIPDLAGCRVPVTEESKSRRLMYRQQQQRETTLESYAGDYMVFLKDCRMEVRVTSLDEKNLERVYELAQRTNQLNFSGNRYPHAQLKQVIESGFLETCVVKCSDRFGSYGIVGFAVVDIREPRLLDLMFSCRIQGKRVEHAVLSFLLKQFVPTRKADFYANYLKTEKNVASGKVFEEMGFECVGEKDGVQSLVFRHETQIQDDGIIKFLEDEKA